MTKIDTKIGSNRNINKGETYHHKYQLPVNPPEAHAAYKMHLVKSPDDKSTKDFLAAQHEQHEARNGIMMNN